VLEEQYPDGSDHFWSTTFNCIKHFPTPGNGDASGSWSINLNSPAQEYVPSISRVLIPVSKAFFARFSDIRVARDATIRHDGSLFQLGAWKRIVLADLALKDFTHLRQFSAAEMHGWGLERDDALLKKIRLEFAKEIALQARLLWLPRWLRPGSQIC
jgi:hypothetical protein